MILRRISLRNYRGIEEREIEFARGVTIVQGPNEAGKSSIVEAINLVFEYPETSKAAPVQATYPVHRDEGPEVEVEVESGAYRFVYRKRYKKRTIAELRVMQPTPENLTGRPAHERARAILDETLDADLWKALRVEQGRGIEQAGLIQSGALTAALDEAAAGDSARESDGVLFDRVEGEYLRYFTATGRTTKERLESQRHRDALRDEVDELEHSERSLQSDLDEHLRLGTERKRLAEEKPGLVRDADLGTQRWKAAEKIHAELREAASELEAATLRFDAAQTSQRDRTMLVEAVENSRRKGELLQAERAQIDIRLKAADARLATAQGALAQCNANLQAAQARASRIAAAETHRRNEADCARLKRVQVQLQELRRERDTAASRVAAGGISEDVLGVMRGVALSVGQARVRLEESFPRVALRALADSHVVIDGQVLDVVREQTLERGLDAKMCIELPGQLEITVTPGTTATELEDSLRDAEMNQVELYQRHRVASLDEAQRSAREFEQASRNVEEIDRRIGELLAGQPEAGVEAEIVRLENAIHDHVGESSSGCQTEAGDTQVGAEPQPTAGPGGSPQSYDALRAEVEQAHREQEQASSDRGVVATLAARTVERLDAEARALESQCQRLEQQRHNVGDAALLEQAKTSRVRYESTAQRAAAFEREYERLDATQLRAQCDAAVGALEALRQKERQRELELARVSARLESQQEAGLFEQLEAARARLRHANDREQSSERRARASRLLYETLRDKRDAVRKAYVAPLTRNIEYLGQMVFADDFRVSLSDTLQIESRTVSERTIAFDALSVGAQEQLTIMTRLAAAMIVAEREGVPVILDDTLGNTDPVRLERMGAMLSKAAQSCQIIILTCTPARFEKVVGAKIISIDSARRKTMCTIFESN